MGTSPGIPSSGTFSGLGEPPDPSAFGTQAQPREGDALIREFVSDPLKATFSLIKSALNWPNQYVQG